MIKGTISARSWLMLIAMSLCAGMTITAGVRTAKAASYNSCIAGCGAAQNNCRRPDARTKPSCANFNLNACQQSCKQNYREPR